MIAGFKDRFVPFVKEGSKTHTIRDGSRWRVGKRLDAFQNVRQKSMRLILRAPVVKVERIEIFEYERVPFDLGGNHVRGAHRGPNGEALLVRINGEWLAADEAEALFRRDGFRDPSMMASYEALMFWKQRLPFSGQIIHWDFRQAVFE